MRRLCFEVLGLFVVLAGACVVQPQPEPPLDDGDGHGDGDTDADIDAGGDADSDADADGDTDSETDSSDEGCGAVAVVSLVTEDGLTLEADFYSVKEAGAPGVVLFHMHPPGGFTRQDYPVEFLGALQAAGMNVLNVDRRGAGGSEGDPADAPGPDGRLDALAAYEYLAASPCAVDVTRLAWIGASNGTTTVLDFTVLAAGDDAVEDSSALVFLTGGDYTENQNDVADNLEVLEAIPILFAYQASEADWSVQFQSGAPPEWEFLEVDGGHGTDMFAADETIDDSVLEFLTPILVP